MSETKISWKVKLGLILFGLTISLIASELVLEFFVFRQKGTEFSSLDDLRRAMLRPDSPDQDTKNKQGDKYESVNLRGLVVPNPDDRIIYDLIPNLSLTFQRAPVKINSCGMRGPERPILKDADTFRIALLGDSFTFGWGVKQDETFAQILEDKLNEMSKGHPRFEVLNLGVPGYSTFQEVAKFEETGLSFDPDAVLVFFIENDFALPFYVKDIYNPGSILSSVAFARLTWQAMDPKREEQKLQMTKFDANKSLSELGEIGKARGIPIYITINPKKNSAALRKKLWVLNDNSDIQYIDMREAYQRFVETYQIPDNDLVLSFDPHPSPLRHKIYGNILASSFMEFIQK